MVSTRFRSRAGIALALCLLLLPAAQAERVVPSLRSRAPPPEAERDPSVPPDSVLLAQGARIGQVFIRPRELFDPRAQDETTALSRLANRLHISTRESTIADQLLFRSGDVYQPALLAESARILRDTRYLRDAAIRPVAFRDGLVDVEVVTQDVWTFNPSLNFGRSGGANHTGFEVEEMNLLGTGTQLGVGFKSDVDRDSKYLHYHDRQLGSSWWDLAGQYSDNSDGRLGQISLQHPFYSLDTRWAAGVSLLDDERTDSRYDLGEIIDQYATRQRHATIYFGRSAGLRDGWTRRYTAGFTFDDHQFEVLPDGTPTLLMPEGRRLAYPWVGIEWVQDQFRTGRNRDQIEKTEDYFLGWRASARLGFAATQTGSDRNAALLAARLDKGVTLTERQTLELELGAHGRVEDGKLRAGLLRGESRYYFRQSPRRILFMNLAVDAGTALDADEQILLGGDSGLRGYPLRYQAGSGRWLFTAEQRLFTNWFPLQLFNVGGAVFYDMGATWGRDPLGTPSRGVLRDIGLGLRLGNARSALGNVLHLDVAFPLDKTAGIQGVQFLVQTRNTF